MGSGWEEQGPTSQMSAVGEHKDGNKLLKAIEIVQVSSNEGLDQEVVEEVTGDRS